MNYLITGAAGGIGQATVRALIEQGAGRFLLVDRDAEALDRAAQRLANDGALIETHVADLADPAAFSGIASAARSLGELHGVVSNAGVISPGLLTETSLADFDRVFAINTRATWLLALATAEILSATRGSFLAVASISADHAVPGVGAYSASKAALVTLCRQLALEWAGRGVRVNCIAPGTTETGMTSGGLADPAARERREAMIPLGRVGQPDDIAQVIAFLLSERSSFVNGVNWAVDGGQAISLFHGSRPAIGLAGGSAGPDRS